MWSRYCGRLSGFLSRRDVRRYLFRKSTPHHIWRMFTLTCFVTRSKLPGEQRSNNFEDEDDDEYENDCLWPCRGRSAPSSCSGYQAHLHRLALVGCELE